MLMRLNLRLSQTTVEYLLLITVLLLVFLAALGVRREGNLRDGIETYVDRLGDRISEIIE